LERRTAPRTEQSLGLNLVESLFDHLPDAAFALKDSSLRYQSANAAMCELCGVRGRAELQGRTARDFFSDAARYETWDRLVQRAKRPIKDRLYYCWRLRGRPVWLLTTVWPVAGAGPEGEAVASISRLLQAPDRRHPTYERLAEIVDYIHASVSVPVDIAEMARRAGVSISQLERDFVKVFGLPPRRYLTKVRFEAALDLLKSGVSIAEVAHACGYADQSAFTRRFRAAVGMSPREYRRASAALESF
jgi:AraC-like DNA-binding protein